MKKVFFVAILICISYTANAQISTLLEKGKSGIGIQAGAEMGDNLTGLGGKIGGSIGGVVDIEILHLSETYSKYMAELTNGDATANFFSGKATWWLFRTELTPTIELNMGIAGGFEYSSFDNYKYIAKFSSDTSVYKSFVEGTFGLVTSINFHLSETWLLQPSFSIQFEGGTEKITTKNNDNDEAYTGVITDIGLTLGKRFSKGSMIYLKFDQFADSYSSGNYYSTALGYAIPF
ncbi:MAG: hypothetical protein WCR42_16095 [bacterium]